MHREGSRMKEEVCSCLRARLVEFLIQSAQDLQVSPIVKYSALSLFADRFYPALTGEETKDAKSWLLRPLRESNLQLFALVAIWISSKIHDSPSLSVKSFKSLADITIKEQHFTTKDFLEAELVLMQVLKFEIGMLSIPFRFFEDLLTKFSEVARVGKQLSLEACMDIMDLIYEKGEISSFNCSSHHLAASIVVAAYAITVPLQKSEEFPILVWVKFVTSCREEDIVDTVKNILMHVFEA